RRELHRDLPDPGHLLLLLPPPYQGENGRHHRRGSLRPRDLRRIRWFWVVRILSGERRPGRVPAALAGRRENVGFPQGTATGCLPSRFLPNGSCHERRPSMRYRVLSLFLVVAVLAAFGTVPLM